LHAIFTHSMILQDKITYEKSNMGNSDRIFLGLMVEKIRKIYSYRYALWSLSLKQLKAKYAGSILGISWAIINPLLMMAAITFVFTIIFTTGIKDFSLFALSGILPWMSFSTAISEATPSLLAQKGILHQFSLPKEILPLSAILSHFLNFLIGWSIILPVFLFHNPGILKNIFLFPAVFLLTCIFTCGIGLLFSVVNIVYRDLEHLLGILLMFWMWVTPVFYSAEMVPSKFRWIFNFNPMTPFIYCNREIIFQGRIPGLAEFLAVIGWAFFSLCIGLMVSVRLESSVLKRI
jgi:lipopolysaccharide transport system permease protein